MALSGCASVGEIRKGDAVVPASRLT
jgi:hypothetical protein